MEGPILTQGTFNKLGRGLLDDQGSLHIVVLINNNVKIWVGPFWIQGHNFNKLGRGLLADAIYQKYQSSIS